jgi:hypothetical protein
MYPLEKSARGSALPASSPLACSAVTANSVAVIARPLASLRLSWHCRVSSHVRKCADRLNRVAWRLAPMMLGANMQIVASRAGLRDVALALAHERLGDASAQRPKPALPAIGRSHGGLVGGEIPMPPSQPVDGQLWSVINEKRRTR